MSLLFDVSPPEETKKLRKGRAAVASSPPPPASAEEEHSTLPMAAPMRIMGRVDGETACVYSKCGAECHDIVASEKGRWLLECCFCGTGQWILALDSRLSGPEPQPESEFAWPEDGSRFAGKPLGEIKPEVIEWAAKHESNEGVRATCESWLARQAEVAYATQDDTQEGA